VTAGQTGKSLGWEGRKWGVAGGQRGSAAGLGVVVCTGAGLSATPCRAAPAAVKFCEDLDWGNCPERIGGRARVTA